MLTYRSTGLVSAVVFFAILLLILSTTPSPAAVTKQSGSWNAYAEYIPKPKIPKLDSLRSSFTPPTVHKPPEQKNSTGGGSKWYTSWKWLKPFSSSVTLDENRAVLPQLRERPPIYTYYDASLDRDKELADADAKLLLAWRRAWFAQGFRPVVLGPSEAKNNRLYDAFNSQGLAKELENDFMAWMAWGNMGTGVFADWKCFPMGLYDDRLLFYLRRGSIPTHITRLEHLGSALFSAEQSLINDAINAAIESPKMKNVERFIDLVPQDMFRIESASSIAFYDPRTVKSKYPTIADTEAESPATGQLALIELINSHLHTTFQNIFESGISVLKPSPEHTTALISPASRLASLLAECSRSSVSKSCPPNNPRCRVCKSGSPLEITYPDGYQNQSSSLFTIGAVPHPYTFITLRKGDDNVTTPYVRRESGRDPWLVEATKHVLGEARGGPSRVVAFKDIVAGDHGISRGLWFTVENLPAKLEEEALPAHFIDELDWYFGFVLPRKTNLDSKKEASAGEKQLEKEFQLINKARDVLNSKDNKVTAIRDVVEAWDLADTEVWRFVRAYRARGVVERQKWEEEEKGFAGS